MATTKKKTANYDPLAKERVAGILDILQHTYPDVRCALHHENAWQLLVATILSAQCTDVRVNIVTPSLFKKFPTAKALAKVEPEAVEALIMSTGFYHNKAKSIVGAARRVMEEFGGTVPETMEGLLSLPGVARKTANVVLGSWFGRGEGVVVDTHVHRISRRLELTKSVDRAALTAYCLTWDRLVTSQRLVTAEGVLGCNSQGIVRHPAVAVVEAASKDLRAWCAEFGFTPSAEAKLSVQEADHGEEDVFSG